MFDAQASLAPNPVSPSVGKCEYFRISILSHLTKHWDDIAEVDMVADMVTSMVADKLADMVADMVADKLSNMAADMVADKNKLADMELDMVAKMEVDKVADIFEKHGIQGYQILHPRVSWM